MKKFMSLLLSVLLLLSLVPMTATAASEKWNSFVYYQDGAVFSVEATEFTGSGSYKFIAAAYDADDKLVSVKSTTINEADYEDGTLEAEVDLETDASGNFKEADNSIDYVKTMLWDSFAGMRPVAEAHVFGAEEGDADTIKPVTVSQEGIYSSLTNGFYEPVEVTYKDTFGYFKYTEEAGVRTYKLENGKTPGTSAISDGDLTNTGGYSSTAVPPNWHYYHGAKLSTAVTADRLVLWTSKAQSDVYLSTAELGPSTMHDIAKKQTKTGLYYVDTLDAMDSENSKHVYNLATPAGETYNYIITAADAGYYVGTNRDLALYNKVTQNYVVDEFTLDVNYNGLAYSQDGPVFTVNAQEFSTNATELYLVATAFADADATGNVLAQVSEPVAETATLTKSVNLEKNGVVASNMASFKVEVIDALGNKVLPAWTKNITNNPPYSLLSGLYTPITEQVSYNSGLRTYWTKSSDENDGNWPGSTWNLTPSQFYDGDLTTNGGTASTAASAIYIQNEVTLSAEAKIDKVVAVYYNEYTPEFYLSKGGLNRGDNKSYINKFTTDTTDSALYYLGGEATCTLKEGKKWMIADADGDRYTSMIAHCEDNRWGWIYEWQAYTKVQDEYEVSPHIVPTYEVARNAAAFAYGSATGKTPAMAVDGDDNTAWVSNNESDYRDQLILDLGTAYTIDNLKITMAEGSDQGFVVYGMNTLLNNATNQELTRNVSATEFNRTALTDTITGLVAGPNVVATNGTETAFRYLVFEQDPENETNPSFGFADIKVYTTDAAGASHTAVGAVAKVNSTVAVMRRLYSANNFYDSSNVDNAENILDSDPRTIAAPIDTTMGLNGFGGHLTMLDLGTPQKVSQVVFQSVSEGVSYPRHGQYFMIVASNEIPVGVTVSGGAVTAVDSRIDILARHDKGTNMTIVEDPGLNVGNHETGLLVFDVPEEFANNEYRYIGVMKIDTTDDGSKVIRSRVGTLQAYTAAQ